MFDLSLNGKLQLYADDSVIMYSFKPTDNMQQALQNDVNEIMRWLERNCMALNVTKTNYVVFGPQRFYCNVEIVVKDRVIERADSVRYLGLVIDSDLKWKSHISHVRRKVVPYCFALRRIRRCIPESAAWAIYYAFIYPHFLYMCSVFGSSYQNAIEPLMRLQNKIIKIIRQMPSLTPTMEIYPRGTLPLRAIYFYDVIVLFYKITRGLIKSTATLLPGSDVHGHFTRSRHHLRVPYSRTELSRRNALRLGLRVFNSIPQTLKDIPSIDLFKCRVRFFVVDNIVMLENFLR